VVGDMAQYLISNDFTIKDVLEKGETMSFPQSVIGFFKGDLGQPVGGFPKKVQKIILKNEKPYTNRPNSHLEPINFEVEFKTFKNNFSKGMGRTLEITDFLSYSLYPKVFTEAYHNHIKYGSVMNIPTKNFFYGMDVGEEIMVKLDKGKNILISLISIAEPDKAGNVGVLFKVNGQLRNISVKDKSIKVDTIENKKTDANNTKHIGAPLQGLLSTIFVKKGQKIKLNQPLFVIEAMKMETTVVAHEEGVVNKSSTK
jgi:pyruvate carboxylase